MTVVLRGTTLRVDEVVRVASGGEGVVIDDDALARVAASHRFLHEQSRSGHPIYGLSTGVGALDGIAVDSGEGMAAQGSLLRAHAAGFGEPMSIAETRATMLVRANNLCRGLSGVAPETLTALVAMLSNGVTPRVPARGSIGASDLAPLAHIGLVLAGEGWATVGGEVLPGARAMAVAGIALPVLGGRDGLALINGLAQSTALAALHVHRLGAFVRASSAAAALSMLGAGSLRSAQDARLADLKGDPATIDSARALRRLLGDPGDAAGTGCLSATAESPASEPGARGTTPLREPLSTRMIHHVLGALRTATEQLHTVVERELNAMVDNPIVDPEHGIHNNVANCASDVLAQALDAARTAIIAAAVSSERRIARLLDASSTGLPAFLVHPGAASGSTGLMIAQYSAAAAVAELRTLSMPAAIHSLPVSAGTEDHASMAPLAALHLGTVLELAWTVVAIELLCAAQAVDLRGAVVGGELGVLYGAIRARVPMATCDRIVADDLLGVRGALAEVERSGLWSVPEGPAEGDVSDHSSSPLVPPSNRCR